MAWLRSALLPPHETGTTDAPLIPPQDGCISFPSAWGSCNGVAVVAYQLTGRLKTSILAQ